MNTTETKISAKREQEIILPANQLVKKCCNSVAGTHTMDIRRSLSAREQIKKVPVRQTLH